MSDAAVSTQVFCGAGVCAERNGEESSVGSGFLLLLGATLWRLWERSLSP